MPFCNKVSIGCRDNNSHFISMTLSLDILVTTYRRPQLLARTLHSIAAQRLPEDVRVGVVVVDNDVQRTGFKVVDDMQRELPGIRYVCEPEANVARARNRALSESRADIGVFIDDDEAADPDWVAALLAATRRFNVPVVLGPVLPMLPPETPRWMLEGGFFDRPRFRTGTSPSTGASGNVLIDLRALKRTGIWFDPAFGRTGGEDTDFFERLKQAGLSWVWCDEAVVHEMVSRDRVGVSWLLKRAYSGGRSYARIFDLRRRTIARVPRAAWHAAVSFAFAVLVPFGACRGVSSATRLTQRSARNLGRSIGLLLAR